jgi:hypothetical protein
MKVRFLNTVDCDIRTSSVVTRQQSLMALVDLFDRHGVSGHCVICFDFHPYEIVDRQQLRINASAVESLGDIQNMMRDDFGAEFWNAEECYRAFAG